MDFSPGWFNPYVRNEVNPGEMRNKRKRKSPIVISDESESGTSSAESIVERRRARTTVFKARKSARITRSAPIVTISSEEDSERKRRRMDSTLKKLGVSESAQARIKASVETMKKIPPMVPKKVPRRKSGSFSCSGSFSSSDSGNVSKSKCSVAEKLAAPGKLGISKNAQDKILASVKNNTDNSKMEVSSNFKRKEKLTVVATTWRSTPCDSSSSESGNSSSSNCTSHCGPSGSLCTCSSSPTGNTHACCSSVESVSCEELTAQGKQLVTVGGNFEVNAGNEGKLGGNRADLILIE